MTDREYLDAYVRTGDRDALSALVCRHRSLVYRVCRRRLARHDDALDATQEVFLCLCRNAGRIHRDLAGWLACCASNTAVSYIRSHVARRRRETEVRRPESVAWQDPAEPAETACIVRACLSEFNTEDRALLESHLIEGRTQSAIASELGISQQAVSKRLARLKETLRCDLIRRGVASLAAALAGLAPGRLVQAGLGQLTGALCFAKPIKTAIVITGLTTIALQPTATGPDHAERSSALPTSASPASERTHTPSWTLAGALIRTDPVPSLNRSRAEHPATRIAPGVHRPGITHRFGTHITGPPLLTHRIEPSSPGIESAYTDGTNANPPSTNPADRWSTPTQRGAALMLEEPMSNPPAQDTTPHGQSQHSADDGSATHNPQADRATGQTLASVTRAHRVDPADARINALSLVAANEDRQTINGVVVDQMAATTALRTRKEAIPFAAVSTPAHDPEQAMPSRLRRLQLTSALGAVALLEPATAFAGVTVDNPDQAAYDALIGEPAYDTVGLITWSGGLASGVYLGQGWVVTAAHVAEESATFGFTIGDTSYASQAIYLHDQWDGNAAAGNDIALIRIDGDTDELATALLYEPTDGGDEILDTAATYTGYGRTGQGSTGDTGSAGELNGGQNLIEAFGQDNFMLASYDDSIFFADFDDPDALSDGLPWSDNQALVLEYMIAGGDSGGGVFVDADGQAALVGINSFVLARDGEPDSDYGDIAGATYLPDYYDWLTDITGLAPSAFSALEGDLDFDGDIDDADLGLAFAAFSGPGVLTGNPAADLDRDGDVDDADLGLVFAAFTGPADPEAVPEPTALALLAIAGTALVCRRRRPTR